MENTPVYIVVAQDADQTILFEEQTIEDARTTKQNLHDKLWKEVFIYRVLEEEE